MTQDSSTLSQIQSLLGNQSPTAGAGMSLLDTDAIIKALMPVTIIATAVSVLIALLYLFSIIQRFRVDRAILESRNLLREMNERDKSRQTAPAPTPAPAATRPQPDQ